MKTKLLTICAILNFFEDMLLGGDIVSNIILYLINNESYNALHNEVKLITIICGSSLLIIMMVHFVLRFMLFKKYNEKFR